MKKESVVGLTNKVSIVAVFLLLYWVFIFSVSSIFGFKVFKENVTETFFMAVLGILALLIGAVIVNIMFNMTIISEAIGKRTPSEPEGPKKKPNPIFLWGFILSFPIIAMLLYIGDLRTSGAKERHLVKSARYLIENNSEELEKLAEYRFDSVYVDLATKLLNVLSKQDESFPSMYVIVQDQIEGKKVLLQFGGWFNWGAEEKKVEYIYSCSTEERKYLEDCYATGNIRHRFSSADGKYELYYPIKMERGFMVLYFTDRQRYGKIGS